MSVIKSEKISAFQLAMITVAYVASIRMLAPMAEYGLTCIFYYLLAALIFLLPSALISAELATAWPERGGIYVWVKEALGTRWGFLAIWLQFLSNIVNMPAFLSFVATTAAYIFMPEYANNKYFLISLILVVFWGATFASFRGMKTAGWLNTIGAFLANFLPVALIFILGTIWLIKGNVVHTDLSLKSLFPHPSSISIREIVFLVGLLFSFTGMETSGSHAMDVKNTEKNYPRGIFLAAIIVACVGFSAVFIAIVVPKDQLSIIAGMMQTFTIFFNNFQLGWLVPILAFCIVLGAVSSLNANVIGPSKGLFGSAMGGEIPPILTKVNKHGMPINMFIFQGVVITLLTGLFLFMPSISSSYWVLVSMVALLYLVMYVLLFISGIVLRYKHPDKVRPYKVPGGKIGMWILGGFGLLSTLFGIVISFIPPSQIDVGGLVKYELTLIIGIIVLSGLGLLIYAFRRPEWVRSTRMPE